MVLSATLPFFALVLLGYVAAWRRWVPPEALPAFNGFLLFFAVPAMLFRFAAGTPFEQLLDIRLIVAWAIAGMAVVAAVAWAARRLLGAGLRDAAFFGLAGGVGNLGFMGIPMLVALMGERAAAAPILAIAVDTLIVGPFGLMLAEMAGATRRGWRADTRDAVGRVLLNPFLIAMLVGALFSGMQWSLPGPIDATVGLLAAAAGPCALFAIGVSLVRPDQPLRSPILALPIAAKLIVHPLVAWLAMFLLGVDPFTTTVAVLAAALPSAGWVFIFASRYEADAGRVSAVILLTTALAFVTFSALAEIIGISRMA